MSFITRLIFALLILYFGLAFLLGTVFNPVFWQMLRNSYYIDKEKRKHGKTTNNKLPE